MIYNLDIYISFGACIPSNCNPSFKTIVTDFTNDKRSGCSSSSAKICTCVIYFLEACANFKTYLAIFDGSLSIHALLIIGGNSSNIFITSQLYVSFSPAGLNESTFALLITEQALAYVY